MGEKFDSLIPHLQRTLQAGRDEEAKAARAEDTQSVDCMKNIMRTKIYCFMELK